MAADRRMLIFRYLTTHTLRAAASLPKMLRSHFGILSATLFVKYCTRGTACRVITGDDSFSLHPGAPRSAEDHADRKRGQGLWLAETMPSM